jgi:maltose O-acetyltransferase
MTEKEKMLGGFPYNSRDPELLSMYHRAMGLLQEFNGLDSKATVRATKLLSELLGHKGAGVWINAPFFCDYGENISIGDNTFINTNCIFVDDNKITIGSNVLLAPFVQIYTATHPLKASERIIENPGEEAPYVTTTLPVTIGNSVWIGGGTIIMPGVDIGDNVTIGGGSVVTKNIPSGVLAYGNPCKVIRQLD